MQLTIHVDHFHDPWLFNDSCFKCIWLNMPCSTPYNNIYDSKQSSDIHVLYIDILHNFQIPIISIQWPLHTQHKLIGYFRTKCENISCPDQIYAQFTCRQKWLLGTAGGDLSLHRFLPRQTPWRLGRRQKNIRGVGVVDFRNDIFSA